MFRVEKNYNFPSLELGSLKRALLSIAEKCNIDPSNLRFSASFKVGNIGEESRNVTLDDVTNIVALDGNPSYLSVYFTKAKDAYPDYLTMFIQKHFGIFMVHYEFYEKDFAEFVPKVFEESLSLSPFKKEETHREEAAGEKKPPLKIVTEKARSNHLKCFISYRFDDTTERYIIELTKFLGLINVIATSGRPYQPRGIDEKVEDNLRADIDFCIYLITASGESTWIRDEVIYSKASGAYVFPLIEDGAKIEEGLLGVSEHITFKPGHICETFIPLLEGINYIRKR